MTVQVMPLTMPYLAAWWTTVLVPTTMPSAPLSSSTLSGPSFTSPSVARLLAGASSTSCSLPCWRPLSVRGLASLEPSVLGLASRGAPSPPGPSLSGAPRAPWARALPPPPLGERGRSGAAVELLALD